MHQSISLVLESPFQGSSVGKAAMMMERSVRFHLVQRSYFGSYRCLTKVREMERGIWT
jgi:hypothetical protein